MKIDSNLFDLITLGLIIVLSIEILLYIALRFVRLRFLRMNRKPLGSQRGQQNGFTFPKFTLNLRNHRKKSRIDANTRRDPEV